MQKPRIAVFSGPASTIANSPPLVTSNKARRAGERIIPGRFDHLVPQILYEAVTVKIKRFSAHPLEEDAAEVYHDDGKDFYSVTLKPEDGPYLLPYMARRKDRSVHGTPFEANDLDDPKLNFGGRQMFYPDASRVFAEIDRTISGRSEEGEGSVLDRKATYDFIRVLPPSGYTRRGEVAGRDYFPYKPDKLFKSTRPADLAKATNIVQKTITGGEYGGAIWFEDSSTIEETLYWMNLLIDTEIPIVGNASQRPHGQLGNDGDRNIGDAIDYIISGKGEGLGIVAVQDQVIYAARELKKGDDRAGGFKATGGHGGILGSIKQGVVTIWYKPNYKQTSTSELNLTRLPDTVEFFDRFSDAKETFLQIKNPDGTLRADRIPRVRIIKYAAYSQEDESEDPNQEVEILARTEKALAEQNSQDSVLPKLHGFVLEGSSPYARCTVAQMKALTIATFSGIPVVRVGRSDPGGRVYTDENDETIEGSNLDANKARLLLMAAMLKLGRLPKAADSRNPTSGETRAVTDKISRFQEIFETH